MTDSHVSSSAAHQTLENDDVVKLALAQIKQALAADPSAEVHEYCEDLTPEQREFVGCCCKNRYGGI